MDSQNKAATAGYGAVAAIGRVLACGDELGAAMQCRLMRRGLPVHPQRRSLVAGLGLGGDLGGGNCMWRAPAIGSGGCAGHQCSPTAGAGESEAARPVEAGNGGCWLRWWWLERCAGGRCHQPTRLTTAAGGAAQGTRGTPHRTSAEPFRAQRAGGNLHGT